MQRSMRRAIRMSKPSRVPTELADGLGGESLPRSNDRFAPFRPAALGQDRPAMSERSESNDAEHKSRVGFPAPFRGRKGLGGYWHIETMTLAGAIKRRGAPVPQS